MKLQNVLFLLTFSLTLITTSVTAQEPNLRIYGVGVSGVYARTEGSDLIEARAAVNADGRTASFRLMVSVRNFGTAPGRYKLQVVAGRARSTVSSVYDVASGIARREPFDVVMDFGTGEPSPGTVFVLPRNPVRADLVLFDGDGRELGRRPFNIILQFRTPPERRTLRTDLTVESARLVYTPAREFRVGRIPAHVDAFMTIRNVGSETWGFRGSAAFELHLGTPETRLEELSTLPQSTNKTLPLPTGLSPGAVNTLSTRLETRFQNTVPLGPRTFTAIPPLRAGVWYTLTASTSSEADLDPSDDSVQFVFMLNNDMSIRESRIVRVTNRVRVTTP